RVLFRSGVVTRSASSARCLLIDLPLGRALNRTSSSGQTATPSLLCGSVKTRRRLRRVGLGDRSCGLGRLGLPVAREFLVVARCGAILLSGLGLRVRPLAFAIGSGGAGLAAIQPLPGLVRAAWRGFLAARLAVQQRRERLVWRGRRRIAWDMLPVLAVAAGAQVLERFVSPGARSPGADLIPRRTDLGRCGILPPLLVQFG